MKSAGPDPPIQHVLYMVPERAEAVRTPFFFRPLAAAAVLISINMVMQFREGLHGSRYAAGSNIL
jgi:hypothetical protein